VEFSVGSGRVLGLGDPYGFNLFSTSPNNQTGYMNFLHSQQAVPEPASLVLLAGGLLALLVSRKSAA
jgi:hypothetical protein